MLLHSPVSIVSAIAKLDDGSERSESNTCQSIRSYLVSSAVVGRFNRIKKSAQQTFIIVLLNYSQIFDLLVSFFRGTFSAFVIRIELDLHIQMS